ncbi:MAG: TMEM53 family protein [Bdellovibrionaceae bacterium]|nr:TMEM53 family protein [Pseudobdellovibrionaceae bacterium]
MAKKKSYPLNGELFQSEDKKFSETVFFVHFYGGSKKALRRHIELVNRLGFDAYAFDLSPFPSGLTLPLASTFNFGVKAVYTDEIELSLNEVAGNKIVFAFSNPSAAAIRAIGQRNAHDVRALICDSGPTAKLFTSIYNLMHETYPTTLLPLRLAKTAFLSVLWDVEFYKNITEDLKKLPAGLPILSIRGWKDKVITPEQIDEVFDSLPGLNWKKLSLPEAGHLNGLRDYPEDYIPGLERFLHEVSTPLDETTDKPKVNSV